MSTDPAKKKPLLFKRRAVAASVPAPAGFDTDSTKTCSVLTTGSATSGAGDGGSGVDLFRRSKKNFPKALEELEEEYRRLRAEKQRKEHLAADTTPGPSPSPEPERHETKRRRVSRETADGSQKHAASSASPSLSPAQRKSSASHTSVTSPTQSPPNKGKGLAQQHSVNARIVFTDAADAVEAAGAADAADAQTTPPPDDPNAGDDSVILLEDTDIPAKAEESAKEAQAVLADDDGSDNVEAIDPEFEEYIIRAQARDAAARAVEAAQEARGQVRDPTAASAATSQSTSQTFGDFVSESTPHPSGDQTYRIFITPHLHGSVPPLIANARMNQKMQFVQDAFLQHARNKGLQLTDDEVAGIVLTWKGNKIYLWTTGQSLGIQPDSHGRFRDDTGLSRSSSSGSLGAARGAASYVSGGLHLEIWTRDLYDAYLQSQEKRRLRHLGEMVDEDLDSDDDGDGGGGGVLGAGGAGGGGDHGAHAAVPAASQQRIRLVLKSRDYEKLNMSAHADTTVATLVAAFREQRQIPADKTVAIHWDGDPLDEETTVAEAEMEDLDNLEVFVH